MTVGLIGLGSMGAAIVTRLLDEGRDVAVWNRSESKTEALVAAGAHAAASPAEILDLPVSLSTLANDAATESVLTAANLSNARGNIHCCMASVSPPAADRLHSACSDAGVRYLATPVIGRPEVAGRGALNILAAGDADALAEASPVLESLSARIWPLGDVPRMANVAKIAVNYNIIHALQALAESVTLMERHGASGAEFVDLLTSTLFDSVVYRGYGGAIAARNYFPAGFGLELGRKDLGLAIGAAEEVALAMPTASVLDEVFAAALNDPALTDADWASLAEVARKS